MKKIKNYIWSVAALAVALTTTSCQNNDFGSNDLSGYTPVPVVSTFTFNHPCALYSATEFATRKAMLDDGSAPQVVKDAFAALKANKYTNGSYGVTVNAHQQIVRGDATGTIEGVETYPDAMRDAAAAYQFGLLWRLTGDAQYAEKAINILNTWASVCQEITANDANQYLAAGGQGFTFALAGEEVRDYSGWAADKFQVFKTWMKNVFAKKNIEFLKKHANVTCGQTHYWSNWDLVNLCSYFQIGILTEDADIINYVINYFTSSGSGNGNISLLCIGDIHTDPLGSGEELFQNQESGRDQGHAEMSAMVTIQLCQAAWAFYQSNPSVSQLDFYAQGDQAVRKMVEYVALTNYKNADDTYLIPASNIPFTTVGPWCTNVNHDPGHQHTAFSQTDRGGLRPNWEMLVSHYKAIGTGGTKYATMMADKLRPEKGAGDTSRYGDNSGAFDQIGWGTLMTYTE